MTIRHDARCWWRGCVPGLLIAIVFGIASTAAFAQSPAKPSDTTPNSGTIQGSVRDSTGKPVSDASVILEEKSHSSFVTTKTNADGAFAFTNLAPGIYSLKAEKAGLRSPVSDSLTLSVQEQKHCNLILTTPSVEAMEFDDKPNFTIAGVTDWTAAGGHGSDINLRTSEALAKDTLTLKSSGSDGNVSNVPQKEVTFNRSEYELRAALLRMPESFEANHQLGEFYLHSKKYHEAIPLLETAYRIDFGNYDNAYALALAYKGNGDFASARKQVQNLLTRTNRAELHSLLGDLDEQSGDPLEAVHEYERAAELDPSEQNYFAWATELLLHRAVEPAVKVFAKGTGVYPKSARMLAGLGAALYASGSYDDAAQRLCAASDLNPADPGPYIFLGKMDSAVPAQLACVEPKLVRFAEEQPENALAYYYYAMAISKRQKGSQDAAGAKQVEVLLEKAVTIDPKLGEAYVQLGALYSNAGNMEQAVCAYKKAIEINPRLSEAHFGLGQAYTRTGEKAKAEQEFHIHEEIEKTDAAAVEQQRRELRQFLVVLQAQPAVAH